MTLVDVIIGNLGKKFEETSKLKDADLVVFNSKDFKFNEVIFVVNTMASYMVGYSLDQQGQLREISNRTIDTKSTIYSKATMYKKKSDLESLPWKRDKIELNDLSTYFR